jgi:hypothetical protein
MPDPSVPLQSEADFERALVEYRDLTGDFQDFADLPLEVQNEILRRSRQIETESEERV